MISYEKDKDSIRSSSPIIIHNTYTRNSSLLSSCCGCYRTRQNSQQVTQTVNDIKKSNVHNGLFKRIQFFKAQKRQSSVRKQQIATTSSSITISNGHLVNEIERLPKITTNEQQYLNIITTTSEVHNELPLKYLQSKSFSNRLDTISHNLNNGIDSYSFADIEIGSSINDEKCPITVSATPKSIISHNRSSMTTNLSAYSTQSLLQKLLDKAQILDDYYQDISTKISKKQPISSLSSSSNSLLDQTNTTPRLFLYRNRSNDSIIRKPPRRKYRHLYDNVSSDSSRFDLYDDEDNILRELIRFNNDIDLILSRLEMEGENLYPLQQTTTTTTTNHVPSEEIHIEQSIHNSIDDCNRSISIQINDQEEIDQTNFNDIITMRTNTNELNIHLLLSNDIDRVRELALAKLLKITEQYCNSDNVHNYETITLAKLNKLPKSTTWKGKCVFGVPLRIYQQTTGHILPIAITNALQYTRMHAGKCDGLFRKPGVKSKIDRLRLQIETLNESCAESSLETIKFDEYQPYVVADLIRQYFRELPECLIPPSLTRLLCDLLKHITQEEQLLVIRYIFLILPDETREVLETILRFLLDISVRLGNNQVNCRSLARIFLPSVFQSFYDMQQTSSKILWWKWKKEKSDGIVQENERLILENCLMTMILNVDVLCRVPSALSDELNLPSARKTKRLDELVRNTCNGEFHIKKFISKNSEQFLQFLSSTKFKNIQTNIDGVNVSIHKPSSDSDENNLPIWKCSIDIPNTNVKQVYQRILHDRYLWDQNFVESRTVEKIDDDKEIVQYVLNYLDLVPVRSFCEFRFSKKITSRSASDANAMLISAVSIDHLQNHFLPGSMGSTYNMHYYITPSSVQPGRTTVTQIACVDYSGRSTQWYENVYGSLLAHNLLSLRNTFANTNVVRI
ncbi:unnamed protein product [Adineta steineri]|uniref:Uncharacterized protein n=1 Tax=Adineta steineri TaxID=433720 RepID=A0A818WIV2_9BILA|nr:unnamed protein product [Adineta steineri]